MLYIVFGQSGEYSDWREWAVAAYADEILARKHAELAGAEARMRKEALHDWFEDEPVPAVASAANPFDPTLAADDDWELGHQYRDEIEYTVGPVELRVSLPEVSGAA